MRVLPVLSVVLTFTLACGDDDGDDGDNGGVDGGTQSDAAAESDSGVATPTSVAPYINRDTGLATENANVNMESSCGNPDVEDSQDLSDADMVNRNVHIDACLRAAGADNLDGQATFESSGVGFISACPDPDSIMDGANGPKTSTATDTNSDSLNDRCVQSGYQEKDSAGDLEFHARFNNDDTAGTQTVVFCYDTNGNGCADETLRETVTITWTEAE